MFVLEADSDYNMNMSQIKFINRTRDTKNGCIANMSVNLGRFNV